MEKNILTNEQLNYYINNQEEAKRIDKLSNDLFNLNQTNEISLNSEASHKVFNEMFAFLRSNYDRINANLEPFEKRNSEYEEKRMQIIKEHGFNNDDFYDEETMNEITLLQKNMKKEAENYSCDLRTKILNERTTELNNMMEANTTKSSDALVARFK